MSMTMKSMVLAGVLVAGTAAAIGLYQPPLPDVKPAISLGNQPADRIVPAQNRPKVEVVFVLDTTSSMSGLIEAAKNNIWSIASSMASAQPAPDMRMGLVAFRDRGDAYITRVLDLSRDLDAMYVSLTDFKAQGGGDGPESVNAALLAAVNDVSWSQGTDSYKVIFLVGDAPPHMDYQGEVQYPEIIRQAQAKGIVINCIQAGDEAQTRKTWQHIASLNQGEYFQVEQGGNAVAVTTPFDTKLAKLARDLEDTRLFYGSKDEREKQARKVATEREVMSSTPAAVQAKRAEFNATAAGADNLYQDGELVSSVIEGRVELDKLKAEDLPAPMVDMSKEEQQAFIAQTVEKRKQIQESIEKLGEQRQQYIVGKLEEAEKKESLDAKIYNAIRGQAKAKGLSYESGPSY